MADTIRLEPIAGLVIEWDVGPLMRAADGGGAVSEPGWELTTEPDWGALESLRLIGAAVGERALAAAAARPAGAPDHRDDAVALTVTGPEGPATASEALLSTELDSEGQVRRLGFEIWFSDGAGARMAADRTAKATTTSTDGVSREVTPLAVRMGGHSGAGIHELLLPAG